MGRVGLVAIHGIGRWDAIRVKAGVEDGLMTTLFECGKKGEKAVE